MKVYEKNPHIVYKIGEKVQVHTVNGLNYNLHGQWGKITEVTPPDTHNLQFWHEFTVKMKDGCEYVMQSVFLRNAKEQRTFLAFKRRVIELRNQATDPIIKNALQLKINSLPL